VRDNPVTGVRYVPSKDVPLPQKRRPLTMAELDRFMRSLPAKWRILFLLLSHTGVRIGELLGLRWSDVHLGDDPYLIVDEQVYRGERKRLKSANAYRAVPLSPNMARALTDWRRRTEYPEATSPVFASEVGTALDYSDLYKRVWVPARDAAGIPAAEVGAFHAFRRTLASVVHESGTKSSRQLSDWLGHADPAFTVREYVGTMDAGIGTADFLDELVPVDKWATSGQPTTHEQPQNGNEAAGKNPNGQAANGDQPQTAATPEPAS
jgi:integrase